MKNIYMYKYRSIFAYTLKFSYLNFIKQLIGNSWNKIKTIWWC